MTNEHHDDPFLLIDKYLSGDMTETEQERFLGLVKRNAAFAEQVRKNIFTDLLLMSKYRDSVPGESETTAFRRSPTETKAGYWPEVPDKPFSEMPPEEEAKFWSNAVAERESQPPRPIDEELRALIQQCRRQERRDRLTPSAVKRARRPWKAGDFFFVACLLVVAALGVGLYLQDMRIKHGDTTGRDTAKAELFIPVAKISELVEPVWNDRTTAYQRGQQIDMGEIALDGGQAKIEFGNGAVVILQAPVQFTINGALATFCAQGRISATIPPEATGFTVHTPLGTVVDRGTEFFLSVDKNEIEVETNKGVVEVATVGYSSSPLRSGEAIRARHGARQKGVRTNAPRFTSPAVFALRLSEYVARLREEKKRTDLVLDADETLLARFDAENRDGDVIPNTSRAGKKLCSELNVADSPTTEGRWPGSRALGFTNRTNDCVFRLDGTYRRLVLSARIRFDHLGTQDNALCAGRLFVTVPGSFSWQICRTGELMFFVTDRQGHTELFSSEPVMTVRDCGVWFNLSVVADVDTGEITHYVNGRPVSKLPWKNAIPLVPGTCILGNKPKNVTYGAGSRFDGAIDEFIISTGTRGISTADTSFSRASSPVAFGNRGR